MTKNKLRQTAVSSKAKRKVFIVDDHPILCKGLKLLINQEADFKVCGMAAEMSTALLEIEKSQPHLIIVDITLGETSGIRLLEELDTRYTDLPTLVFSVHEESLYAERCLRAGARGYVMKTEPSDKIIEALRKILNGEIYVSNTIGTKLLNRFKTQQPGIYNTPIDRLSNRELEVFELIGQGLKTTKIAERLSLSVKTIETYMEHIKKKMSFKDSRNLFMHAVQWHMGEKPADET